MKEYVIRGTWATACWWRETRARDAWRGTTTTSSTTSSRPSTNAAARWNASTAYPTARATSSSRVRRTTANMTLADGWPKTVSSSTTTTARATSCSRKKEDFACSRNPRKITKTHFLPLFVSFPNLILYLCEQNFPYEWEAI